MGVDPADLRRRFPCLILASHKRFLSGPYENRAALDEVAQMMTGLAYMTGPTGRPLRVGSSAKDIMGGLFGALAVLAALFERDRSGQGRTIRIGLFENCLLLVAQHMVQYELEGRDPPPMPKRDFSWPVYDIFTTADGKQIFVGAVIEGQWQLLCDYLGPDDLWADPALLKRMDQINARERTLPVFARAILGRDSVTLGAAFDRMGIPFSPIARPSDMYAAPHVMREGGLSQSRLWTGETFRAPALPFEIDGNMVTGGGDVPARGADTAEGLSALGMDPSQIAAAREKGRRMSRLSDIYPTDRVTLREVGLRDGLQPVRQFPSTSAKLDWLAREHAAGVRHFELGSFLPPTRFPQFADLEVRWTPRPRCPPCPAPR